MSDIVTFILREKEDAILNSEYLKEKNILSKAFPIITTEYYHFNFKRTKFNYLVLTSPKSIKALIKLEKTNKYNLSKEINIFVIGLETSEKLYRIGYKNIFQASGNSDILLKLIIEQTFSNDLGLWIAAKDRSFDLKNMLKVNDRKIEIYEAYKTLPILILNQSIKNDLVGNESYNFLILSSRNALIAKTLLEHNNLFETVSNKANLIVNSKNVAQKAKQMGWSKIKIIKKNFTKDILDHIVSITK